MTTPFASRTTNLADALQLAEELVSAPGNDRMVVWLQPGPGGVTLRQQFVLPPARPVLRNTPTVGLFQRWFGN